MITYGKVNWFNYRKGYGFITCNNSEEDVFVHYTGIKDDNKSLMKGDCVCFEVKKSERGLMAINVTRSS